MGGCCQRRGGGGGEGEEAGQDSPLAEEGVVTGLSTCVAVSSELAAV